MEDLVFIFENVERRADYRFLLLRQFRAVQRVLDLDCRGIGRVVVVQPVADRLNVAVLDGKHELGFREVVHDRHALRHRLVHFFLERGVFGLPAIEARPADFQLLARDLDVRIPLQLLYEQSFLLPYLYGAN